MSVLGQQALDPTLSIGNVMGKRSVDELEPKSTSDSTETPGLQFHRSAATANPPFAETVRPTFRFAHPRVRVVNTNLL